MNFDIDPKELDLQGPDGMQLIKLIRRLAREVDGEGGGDTPEPSVTNGVFYCTYNVTTAAEIAQAVSDGLLPVVKYANKLYYMYTSQTSIHRFFSVDPVMMHLYRVNCSGSVWSSQTILLQERLDFDYTPTEGSTNPVTSGGVYTALQYAGDGSEPYQQYPEMDGVASPGNSDAYARGNHVHPTDTSRAAASEITRIDAALANKADQASIEQTIEDTVDDWLSDQAPSIGTLSYAAKQALLACFRKVQWTDSNGQSYYLALEAELFPSISLQSITAVFTQGSAVIYAADSLDTLKQYLVVTATYSDSTTITVTDYTLSGTLTDGTSTITVSYGGKTATFDVVVTWVPSAYQEVEFIESTGTQYITTDLLSQLPMSMECRVAPTTHDSGQFAGSGVSSDGNSRFFLGGVSIATTGSNVNYFGVRASDSNIGLTPGSSATNKSSWIKALPELVMNDIYTVVSGIETDGTQHIQVDDFAESRVTKKIPAVGYPFYFMYKSNIPEPSLIRLYYVKLFTGSALLFYGIPCYRKSDNAGGLYDLVSGEFYGNSGTGSFVLGQNVIRG